MKSSPALCRLLLVATAAVVPWSACTCAPPSASPEGDPDGDGLDRAAEDALGTDPFNADTDGDGLPDGEEADAGTDPLNPDSDEDGLPDGREIALGSDPLDADTDDDTLLDGPEVLVHGSSPTSIDTDSDGLSDPAEVNDVGTDPGDADTDRDGLIDYDEVLFFHADPLNPDTDSDGVDDLLETVRGTNPRRVDTDADGLDDALEIFDARTDPVQADTDGDRLTDGDELFITLTNPLVADSDFDGVPDGEERGTNSDPHLADTDGDGLDDGEEREAGTSPLSADTDGDGATDPDELAAGSDPLRPDTDGDGVNDGDELAIDADPLTTDADGDGLSDFQEVVIFLTAGRVADTDADGLDDGVEVAHRLDPLDPSDADADVDLDGLGSAEEIGLGTDPQRADTDGDGLLDGEEIAIGADPLDDDTDGDGVGDSAEVRLGANPLENDSDGDGVPDGEEVGPLSDADADGLAAIVDPDSDNDGWPDGEEADPALDLDGDGRLNANDPDADGDGMRDGDELLYGLDPRDPTDGALDADGDGLSNTLELAKGASPLLVDTDGDGIDDGDELEAGLDPVDPADGALDADLDTLTNAAEIAAGTDPNLADTDGDGLLDDRELALGADPLDVDTDDDGVLDGDELTGSVDTDGDLIVGVLDPDQTLSRRPAPAELDTDADGVSDLVELAEGTDINARDTDGDGLSDGAEALGCLGIRLPDGSISPDRFPTHAQVADTDLDGLSDAVECGMGLNPTDPDHDDDGALDGEELVDCQDGTPDCPAGTFHSVTDPFDPDTDDDGVADGADPGPTEIDFDRDGLLDRYEIVDGFNAAVADLSPPPSGAFNPGPVVLSVPVANTPWLVFAVEVGPASPLAPGASATGPAPVVVVDVDGVQTSHALRWEGPRLLTTRPRRPQNATVTVEVIGADVRVERIFAVGLPDTDLVRPGVSLRTFADNADTDGDGLDDGDETTGAIWLEAEHYAATSATRVPLEGAGNGVVVEAVQGPVLFELGPGDWGFEDGEVFTLFARARRLAPLGTTGGPFLVVDTDLELCDPIDEGTLCPDVGLCTCSPAPCACRFDEEAPRVSPNDHLSWIYLGSRKVVGDRFHVRIEETVDTVARWQLDRVVLVRGAFRPQVYTQSYDELDPALSDVHTVLGVDRAAPLTWRQDLAWGLSDPWEADTDGDGMRVLNGVMADSIGWLTDGREHALTLNAFDLDSDLDAHHGAADPTTFVDDVTNLSTSGSDLVGVGGPDGRIDNSDARDPSPRPLDFDHDGLLDSVEVAAELAARFAACVLDNGCADPDTCPACPAADFDDVADLDALCSVQLGLGATLPLCFFADDDRDDDGLRDGDEDRNRNGRLDPGESDPNTWDSDGDCLGDGVERGLACPEAVSTLLDVDLAADLMASCGQVWFDTDQGFRPGTRGFVPDGDLGASRTHPGVVDTDGDGLSDGDGRDGLSVPNPAGGFFSEDLNCEGTVDTGELDPADPDVDDDLVRDGDERALGTDPFDPDTDTDRLLDGEEIAYYETNPLVVDSDGDGLLDGDEARPRFGDPLTDPNLADTDGDGLSDGDELLGVGPLASCSLEEVCGYDGSCAGPCSFGPSDPSSADTDGDGLSDGWEMGLMGNPGPRTNLNRADTDGDGLTDRQEQEGLGPLAPWGPSDPLRGDSDGDGFLDLIEITYATDPNDSGAAPTAFAAKPGGLYVQADQFTLDGADLVGGGRVLLSCEGRPAAFAVDGEVRLSPVDGQYDVTAIGDVVAFTSVDEVILWSGGLRFGADLTTATPEGATAALGSMLIANDQVEVRFDPPACEVDRDCAGGACDEGAGVCVGVAGPDRLNVCEGRIEDDELQVVFPTAPPETDGTAPDGPHYRSSNTFLDLVRDRLDLRSLSVVGAQDPADFPWVGRTCLRSPEKIRVRMEMFGDFSIAPTLDTPDFTFGGLAGLSLADFPMAPSLPLSSFTFDPSVGSFDVDVPDANLEIGDLGGPGAPSLLLGMAMSQQDHCQYDSQLTMLSCTFSGMKKRRPPGGGAPKTQYTYDGRVDIHRHGLIPFQTDPAHDFAGVDCATGVDLCQDGHLAFNGVVKIPLPGTPGIDAVVEGDLLADVTTADDDELFTGFFGTFRYEQRHLVAIEETGLVRFPFPVHLEAGQATVAAVYDDKELDKIVFHATRGFRFAETVDTNLLPPKVLEMFDADRSDIRGCLDVSSGTIEARGRIYSWLFPIDAELLITPPFSGGEPDISAGQIGISGTMTYPSPFGSPTATVGGVVRYDGGFSVFGTLDAPLSIPGLPAITLSSGTATMTESSSTLEGTLNLPGLGLLDATGTARANGSVNLALSGALAPAGFTMSEVTGSISGSQGALLQGTVAVPFDPGAPTLVEVIGHYRSPTDFRFTSVGTVAVPLVGIDLAGMRVTLSPDGLVVDGSITVPGFTSFALSGGFEGPSLLMTGAVSQNLGPLELSGGEITLINTPGAFTSLSAHAIIGFGSFSLGDVDISMNAAGDVSFSGRTTFAGFGVNVFGQSSAFSTPSASGTTGIGGCGCCGVCLNGSVTVGFDGNGVYAGAEIFGQSVGISSNGCVTWYIGADCGPLDFACPDIPITVCLL